MNSIQAKDLLPESIANSLPTDSSKKLVRNELLKIYQNHM